MFCGLLSPTLFGLYSDSREVNRTLGQEHEVHVLLCVPCERGLFLIPVPNSVRQELTQQDSHHTQHAGEGSSKDTPSNTAVHLGLLLG